jgi:GntR family transcriptional regulator
VGRRRLAKLDLEGQDVFLLIERHLGTELGFADLTIDVVPATKREAELIGARTGEQVLLIRRLTHDSAGRGIDYERIYVRPADHQPDAGRKALLRRDGRLSADRERREIP